MRKNITNKSKKKPKQITEEKKFSMNSIRLEFLSPRDVLVFMTLARYVTALSELEKSAEMISESVEEDIECFDIFGSVPHAIESAKRGALETLEFMLVHRLKIERIYENI